jgi:hypothetical protein
MIYDFSFAYYEYNFSFMKNYFMKLSFDKLLAAFGNMRAMERTDIDDYTEAIINDIKDSPFAVSQQDVLYAATKELGGFYYLKTIIVGTLKIKTKKGAKLNIAGKSFDLTLNTDMDEFESEYSNVSNRFITRIDFQIEKEDVSKIDKSLVNTLVLTAKKNNIEFKTNY